MTASSITLQGPDGPVTAVFKEAAADQLTLCHQLAAKAFAWKPDGGDYDEQQDYAEQQRYVLSLPCAKYSRVWCIFDESNPHHILGTCKTLYRDLIIRDVQGTRREKGYCIASVTCDPAYRRQGLASFLLEKVAEWMDGPGEGAASYLSSSIGPYYESRGWEKQPAAHGTIRPGPYSWPPESSHPARPALPSTRILQLSDIPALCERDLANVAKSFDELDLPPGATALAVLPAPDIMLYLQERAVWTTSTIFGKDPHDWGSICESADVWLWWCPDHKKDQLFIQRICGDLQSSASVEALAGLLLEAVNEARKWKLSQVTIWNPQPQVKDALRLLSSITTHEITVEEQRTKSIPHLRWKGGMMPNGFNLQLNEYFIWS